ncbi:TonB-dependent receptor [Chitinophaga sp.]|uniref:TonB-dependent receptor n=1 Tax=Chitinophaga sp. TaxID=1869181 RepID=UPI0031D30B37
MKLAFTVILLTCMQVSANVFSQQRFTLNLEEIKLARLLKLIEKESDYRFVYSNDLIAADEKVTVNVNNKPLETVLQQALTHTGLTFKVMAGNLVGIAPGSQVITDNPVKGRITDASGAPLPGVSVRIAKTGKGTVTNARGEFELDAPSTATLVISFVGYMDQELPVNGRSTINVTMALDTKGLNEVVVIAYGTANRKTFTGSLAQVEGKALENRPVTNAFSALEGAAPGIQVNAGSGQPGDGPSIRIRGIGSINASSDPLYVVDGVPYSGDISSINPNDIESISLLKDAASSALYGARAANGVVMITTKKGKQRGNHISLRGMQGVTSRGLPEYDRVSAKEYYPLMWEAYRNALRKDYSLADANAIASGQVAGKEGIFEQLAYNPFNVANNEIVGTDGKLNPNASLRYAEDLDWEKALQRTGSRGDYNVNFNGNSEKSDYLISLGYVKEKGFVMKSDFQRVTGRINLNTQPLKWFRTGINANGSFITSNQANTDGSASFVNPFNFARYLGPIYPIHAHDPATGAYLLDDNGNKMYDLGNMTAYGLKARPSGATPGRHVIAETEYNNNNFKRNNLSVRTFGEVSFLRDFKFTTNVSVDITNTLFGTYDNTTVGDGAPAGRASRENQMRVGFTVNELLNYGHSFGKHRVEALAGHENYDLTRDYLYGSRQNIILDAGNTELINFTTTNTLYSYQIKYRTEGYLSRVNYSFDDKYYLSGSFRRDGTSRFSEDLRWGNFWSIGGAWRMDGENFIKNITWIDLLKVRASYGVVGNDMLLDANQNAIYYAWQALYDPYSNANEPGMLQSTIGSKLQWEQNKTYDIGVDFGIFKQRITGSVEYFHRQSSNLLFSVPLPLSSGVTEQYANIGTMYNRGFEVNIGAEVVKTRDFKWRVDVNATTYKNKVTKLPRKEIITGTKKLTEGHGMYDYWLREYKGVNEANGAPLYRAATFGDTTTWVTKTGDTVTTNVNNARYHYAGSAIPDVYGGITNTFNYKNFELSFLVSYQIGGKVYDANYAALMHQSTYGTALHKDALKRWQKAGDITNVPRMDANETTNLAGSNSDRWLESASFLNLRRVSLGYTLPKRITSGMHLAAVNVFASGENLALFSARKGMNITQSFTGVTSNGYVPSRVVTLGINVSL